MIRLGGARLRALRLLVLVGSAPIVLSTTTASTSTASSPVTASCGGTLYAAETYGGTRSVSATDSDGTVTAMSINVSPAAAGITLENFTAASGVGSTVTADVVVGGAVGDGSYRVDVTATNNDAEAQEGSCSFTVTVDPFLTIGEVQGPVGDTDSGTAHESPYANSYAAVQGVIYEKTQEYRSAGGAYHGFFIQNTAATADGNPTSSDGLSVFHLQYPTLLVHGGGLYFPEVGDEVVLWGKVEERFGNTRMFNPELVEVVRADIDLDAEVPAFEANPPSDIDAGDDIQDAYRYWERHEGMRGQVPAGSTVLNGRDVFASSFDSELWVVRPDSLIVQRSEAYERRSFRDPHPLDDIPTEAFDNDNPYRILIGTFGLKAAADDTTTLLAPARTYDTLVNRPTGGVLYNFGKYSIQVDAQLELAHGVDPALNAPPRALDPAVEYAIADFNVENLYDYVDDPFDGCDFVGNAGCVGVSPPFGYVPTSDAAYQLRLGEIAMQILGDLHAPEILMVQEAEDQDICTVAGGVYSCGGSNNADGKPDVLQELAVRIAELGGPMYDAVLDRDGVDDRGITSGYLYRTDRVELLPALADHPVLGEDPSVNYPDGAALSFNTDVQNPKALNATLPEYVGGDTDGANVFTRAPQTALFRVWRDEIGLSVFQDVYVIDNHFSSGPDRRVAQRTEQANYNAAIVDALQATDPRVRVAVGGDLNVYPRPDDPFPPPATSDQLAGLYDQGLTNLWDVQVAANPVAAYSYVYQGQTQTLDQIFLAPEWVDELTQARSAHINSDFPADHPGDGPRGTSDHDPQLAAFALVPTIGRLEALVLRYESEGMITGNNAVKSLLDHLRKASEFEANGQHDAYLSQIYAFIDHVEDKTPKFITVNAAAALTREAGILASAG